MFITKYLQNVADYFQRHDLSVVENLSISVSEALKIIWIHIVQAKEKYFNTIRASLEVIPKSEWYIYTFALNQLYKYVFRILSQFWFREV